MFDSGAGLTVSLGEIRTHAEIIHALAAPLAGRGQLCIACFGEDPDQPHPSTGKPGWPLPPTVVHAEIGDVETTVQLICNLGTAEHRTYTCRLRYLGPICPGARRA